MAAGKVQMRAAGATYVFDYGTRNKILAFTGRSEASVSKACGFGDGTLREAAARGYIYQNHVDALERHFNGVKDMICSTESKHEEVKTSNQIRSIDDYSIEELQEIIAKRTVYAMCADKVQKSLDILLKQNGFTVEMYQYVVEGALNGLKKYMEENK